jgi:hypothetical protein
LPGLAAPSRLTEARDAYDRPFAVLHTPATSQLTIVFAVARAEDRVLLDETATHGWVSHWTERLVPLGQDAGALAASVTLDRAPGRHRLRPPLVNVWVGLTFAGARRSRRGPGSSEVEPGALGARLPAITEQLRGASGQAARPLGAQELCEVVRSAYDYEARGVIDAAYRAGRVPKLNWSDVGPASDDASAGAYRHDGSLSTVWAMSASATRRLDNSALLGLVRDAAAARTRMTVLYRMVEDGLASQMAEADRRSLTWRVDHDDSAPARVAGLACWGLLFTATAEGDRRAGEGGEFVDALPASVRIALRRVRVSPAAAFAACLPLALALPERLELPRRGGGRL